MTIYRYRYLVMLEMTVIYTREKRETFVQEDSKYVLVCSEFDS